MTYFKIFNATKYTTNTRFRDGKSLVEELFEDHMNENKQLKSEFFENLENNSFLLNSLALKMVKLYTYESEMFLVVNKVQRDELFDCDPRVFTVINLIKIGLSNYGDVSGCLHRLTKRIS